MTSAAIFRELGVHGVTSRDEAQDCMAQAQTRPQPPVDFAWQAEIQVVDGDEVLASNAEGDDTMCRQFAQAIQRRYG